MKHFTLKTQKFQQPHTTLADLFSLLIPNQVRAYASIYRHTHTLWAEYCGDFSQFCFSSFSLRRFLILLLLLWLLSASFSICVRVRIEWACMCACVYGELIMEVAVVVVVVEMHADFSQISSMNLLCYALYV